MTNQSKAFPKDMTIASTEHFSVKIPSRPHVTASEGGHLFVEVNDSAIEDRTQLSGKAATELMWLTMITGEAMEKALVQNGLDIYRINYQDNGNWSFLRGERPRLHVHLYGRARNETHQTYGQALAFPDPQNSVYDELEPLTSNMGAAIASLMKELSSSEKYAWFNPENLSFAEPPIA